MDQWEPLSPAYFNIVVNTGVRLVLVEVCGLQEAHHGLEWADGEHNIVLYADDITQDAYNSGAHV